LKKATNYIVNKLKTVTAMNRKVGFIVIFLSVLVCACSSEPEIQDLRGSVPNKIESDVLANEETVKNLDESLEKIRLEEEEKERLAKETQTTVKFDKIIHDFGNVEPEVENKTTFRLTNTGNHPLIVENVEASCGCTTPKKPEKPILPGKSDEIQVSFKSNPGQTGEQNKTVTVTTNTEERIHRLEIRAFVKG